MVGSQQDAEAAALCQLNINFKTVDTVTQTEKGMPAAAACCAGRQSSRRWTARRSLPATTPAR